MRLACGDGQLTAVPAGCTAYTACWRLNIINLYKVWTWPQMTASNTDTRDFSSTLCSSAQSPAGQPAAYSSAAAAQCGQSPTIEHRLLNGFYQNRMFQILPRWHYTNRAQATWRPCSVFQLMSVTQLYYNPHSMAVKQHDIHDNHLAHYNKYLAVPRVWASTHNTQYGTVVNKTERTAAIQIHVKMITLLKQLVLGNQYEGRTVHQLILVLLDN